MDLNDQNSSKWSLEGSYEGSTANPVVGTICSHFGHRNSILQSDVN